MNWQIFIAMMVALPIILLPVAFFWYLNIGRIFDNVKESISRRANRDKKKGTGGEKKKRVV